MLGGLGAAGFGAAQLGGRAEAQSGGCRDGYGQPKCPLTMAEATKPIPEVFAPTGWKTLGLEQVTMDVADYRKEAAFYAALLGWTLRDDDGSRAIMDMGDIGSCIFRAAPAESFGTGPRAVIRSFGWVIENWDAHAVDAALRARGLTPVADNKGACQSFWVKDPDGWPLQICNAHGLFAARRKPATAKPLPLPFAPTGWKTVWFDHISYKGSNYKRSASFYANLLGWERPFDEGTQVEMLAGDAGDVLIRGPNPFLPKQPPSEPPTIDHISYGIAPWDVENVRAALEARGLHAATDTATAHIGPDNQKVADDIYQAAYQSYHTDTPAGFSLQISWVTRDKRLVGATADKPRALRKYPVP